MKQDYINLIVHHPGLNMLPPLARGNTAYFLLRWLDNDCKDIIDYRCAIGIPERSWHIYKKAVLEVTNDLMHKLWMLYKKENRNKLKREERERKRQEGWRRWRINQCNNQYRDKGTLSDSGNLGAQDFRPRTFSHSPEFLARKDIKARNTMLKGEGLLHD